MQIYVFPDKYKYILYIYSIQYRSIVLFIERTGAISAEEMTTLVKNNRVTMPLPVPSCMPLHLFKRLIIKREEGS